MSVTVPHVATIAELRRRAGLAPPRRPLLSVARIEEVPVLPEGYPAELTYGFYTLTLKRGDFDRACYGAGRHDFAAGVLQAHAPRQRVGYPRDYGVGLAGWVLAWHPDLLHDHALAARLPAYGFFRYRREEALHLSDEELDSLWEGFAALQREYRRPVDVHSKRILVACLELLLTYADRFYRRQFVTRHEADSSLAARFRAALERRLAAPGEGLPSVGALAAALHVTPDYLSDHLRALTGRAAGDHIHAALIARAQERLAGTDATVAEVAYGLGFAYPQYFSRLFRARVGESPSGWRRRVRG